MATRLVIIGLQHFRVFQIVDKLLKLGGVEIVGLSDPEPSRARRPCDQWACRHSPIIVRC